MNDFLRDLKHSIRMFAKSPGFTITAVAALTLGIAATTAIFSIVDSVLLKPLPGYDPDHLMILMNSYAGQNGQGGAKDPRRHPRSLRTGARKGVCFSMYRHSAPAS